jgi:hypothetical protein
MAARGLKGRLVSNLLRTRSCEKGVNWVVSVGRFWVPPAPALLATVTYVLGLNCYPCPGLFKGAFASLLSRPQSREWKVHRGQPWILTLARKDSQEYRPVRLAVKRRGSDRDAIERRCDLIEQLVSGRDSGPGRGRCGSSRSRWSGKRNAASPASEETHKSLR